VNLFLRLLIVWLKSRFAPRQDALDEIVTTFRVWPTDQDAFRHMTNSRYFSLTDVCIIDYMLKTRAWPVLARRGWLPIVVYEDLIFKRMLRWPQLFRVRTRLLGWDDAWVVIGHAFERADGTLASEGLTIARFMSRKGERIDTARVVEALGLEGRAPTLPPSAAAALGRAREGYGFDPPRGDVGSVELSRIKRSPGNVG
jgi:acyl-CoA thioesterase FadM